MWRVMFVASRKWLKFSSILINMKYARTLMLVSLSLMLTACLGGLWTGASMVYDRHNVYKKMSDYQLSGMANHVLFDDRILKQSGCSLDLGVINGDVLLAGHLPTEQLRQIARKRLNRLEGYRELFFQVALSDDNNDGLQDGWITTKIRSQIFADSSIDPNTFKIITIDGIVYIMGDVKPDQAEKVLAIARDTEGVLRVVKLMRYYNLSEKPASNR